jgi:hypothetical protein
VVEGLGEKAVLQVVHGLNCYILGEIHKRSANSWINFIQRQLIMFLARLTRVGRLYVVARNSENGRGILILVLGELRLDSPKNEPPRFSPTRYKRVHMIYISIGDTLESLV